ncbi:MAG TPA: pitrilysin family protein [Candidatus Deferrimicrobiaceae bacterium]
MTVARTVLDNGVTVLSEQISHLVSATVGIWVPVGSRAESPSENGIGHFIEHMLFKGTPRRKAIDISREIESVGGSMNACTDREYVFFYAKVLARDFSLAIDILSDIYRNSAFEEGEMEREKGVVLQEILMIEDNPEESLHDFFHESYWGGHPLGLPVQGTAGNITAFSREMVAGYFRDRFWRRGMIVTVVGNLPHEQVVEQIGPALGGLRLGSRHRADPPPSPSRQTFLRNKPIEQLYLCLGAPAVSRTSDRKYDALVLNTLLGGSMSSRLFQRIREERGLAYSVYSSLSSYSDSGILKVCVGTTPDKAREVLEVTSDILSELREGGIADDEVLLARELIRGNILLSLENAEIRMSRMAMSEMFLGQVETPEETLRQVDSVLPSGVRELAAKMLRRECFSLAAVGDLPEEARLLF